MNWFAWGNLILKQHISKTPFLSNPVSLVKKELSTNEMLHSLEYVMHHINFLTCNILCSMTSFNYINFLTIPKILLYRIFLFGSGINFQQFSLEVSFIFQVSDSEREWLYAQVLNEYIAMNYPSCLKIIAREEGNNNKNGNE